MCQCPQRASTYFFNVTGEETFTKDDLCQCPQRASTYFFGFAVSRNAMNSVCVNALNGLLLISSFALFPELNVK